MTIFKNEKNLNKSNVNIFMYMIIIDKNRVKLIISNKKREKNKINIQ